MAGKQAWAAAGTSEQDEVAKLVKAMRMNRQGAAENEWPDDDCDG